MHHNTVPLVEMLSKPQCQLCEEAKNLLHQLQTRHTFLLQEIDITQDAGLLQQYAEEIPVIFINGRKAFKYRLDPQQFLRYLQRQKRPAWRRFWR
jgi:glutaredoxin